MSHLEYALRCCREIPYIKGYQRVYAVVTDRKGRIVAESPNFYTKTHPLQKRYSLMCDRSEHRAFLHAELRTLILARGKGEKLTVARIGASGRALDAYPCPSCRLAIKEAGHIKEICCSLEIDS